MIDFDSQLKLQAYLDGELSAREVRRVEQWLEREAEARALLAELRNTKAALFGAESELKLPESREFFWSKIAREIRSREQAEPETTSVPIWVALQWLQRRLVPVTAVGLLVFVVTLTTLHVGRAAPSDVGEVELASDDMGAITFRSQSEKMTMVWLYNRNDSEFTGGAAFANLELDE